ncbi:MAG: S46 family peptidase, partial [Flavobacteriales bacterium]
MKKTIYIAALLLSLMPLSLWANEGMWLVSLLNRMNEAEMKGLGLNLTKEEIYSINTASLKDAIVRLNYGQCTGEVVSSEGLIFTNHHCGYDAIQTLSTVQNNLLANGFCAKSLAEELPIADFKISFLVRIDDVTQQMLAAVNDGMAEADRDKALAAKTKELIAANTTYGQYEVEVKSFFYGNEYYMMVYQTFSDIRLVGNPPESVGKFGGDTDNWMWPRHTGDFSMLRIYADKNNQPAAYSKDNVPFKPKHFLPVNIDGLNEGDFTMIMGFPGRTSRYLTSFGIEQAVETRNPALIECFDTKLKSWKSVMDADERVRLMYAAKYASTANTWKYYIGQTRGLKRLNVKGDKELIEGDFTRWMNSNANAKSKYAETLKMVQDYYKEWDPFVKASTYSSLCGAGGAEFMGFASGMGDAIKKALAETDEAKRKEALAALDADIESFFKEYDASTDKVVFVNLTNLYRERIVTDRPSWHATLDGKYKGDARAFADKLFETSIFTDKNRLMEFLKKPNAKAIDKDMAFMAASSSMEHAMKFRGMNPMAKLNKGMRQYVAGLREMSPAKTFAPDANSTMRITYGVVDDYKAADAVHYDYYTTAAGIMEKRDNTNP